MDMDFTFMAAQTGYGTITPAGRNDIKFCNRSSRCSCHFDWLMSFVLSSGHFWLTEGGFFNSKISKGKDIFQDLASNDDRSGTICDKRQTKKTL